MLHVSSATAWLICLWIHLPSKFFRHSGGFGTYECGQHVVIDSSRGVMKLVLQGSRDGCSADGLGGSQRGLFRVGDWRRSRRGATGGCAGGGGRVSGGRRGATVTQGSELCLSLCWEAKGQGRGLEVPATTFPPTRHIFRWEKGRFYFSQLNQKRLCGKCKTFCQHNCKPYGGKITIKYKNKSLKTTHRLQKVKRSWGCQSERAARLTLGAEAWSGPIRRIEAASFLASSVLFSSCLQCGKFLVREGLQSVWGPWTWRWRRQRKQWTRYSLTDLSDKETSALGKSVCSVGWWLWCSKWCWRAVSQAGQMTHHLARLPFHLAGPIVLVHLCSRSEKILTRAGHRVETIIYSFSNFSNFSDIQSFLWSKVKNISFFSPTIRSDTWTLLVLLLEKKNCFYRVTLSLKLHCHTKKADTLIKPTNYKSI